MIKVDYDALNEVSDIVEAYNKSIGVQKEDLSYDIPVDAFLEGLIYVQERFLIKDDTDEWGEDVGDYEFVTLITNPRLSKKALSVYYAVKDKIEYSDYMSDVYTKIYNTVKKDGITHVNVNYDNYRESNDYISKLVFLIDKEVKREVLESSGLTYNVNWEDHGVPMYSNKLGVEVRLDEFSIYYDDEIGSCISCCDVIGSNNKTEEEKDQEERDLNEMLEKAGLTDRQKEYIDAFIISNYNQAETARYLGINEVASRKMIARIRGRLEESLGFNDNDKKEKVTFLDKLDEILNSGNVTEETLAEFIKKYINRYATLEEMVYCIEHEVRSPMVKFLKGEDIPYSNLNKFLIKFLKNYYEKYSKTTK